MRLSPCGFSLIEVVVAMSILSIGILATMQMGLIARYRITTGNLVTQAILLGQSEIERMKHHSVNEVQEVISEGWAQKGLFTVRYQFSDPLAGHFLDAGRFNCETGNQDGSGSCMASVTVSWQRGGRGRSSLGSVEFRTLLHGGAV